MSHINNWKNIDVFKTQLELNLTQLSSPDNYPEHWIIFLEYLKEINPKSILDIGCGVGSYYKLIKLHCPDIEYTGVDYSEEAISLAIHQWDVNCFYQKDLWDLNKDWISRFDLLHLGALLDVLPNGNEALEFILSLDPKNILIGRIETTNDNNIIEEYTAYNLIKTYKYKHSWNDILNLIKIYDYQYSFYKNNLYLKK